MNAPGSSAPTPASAPTAASASAPTHGSGPVDPAPPPPPGAPRAPAPERPRGARRSFLAAEGGLILLSLMLAVMVWYVVRDVVDEYKTRNVTVVPETLPGYVAFVEEQVTINLRGKRGEVEDALDDIERRGKPVKLKVDVIASNLDERPFDERDEFQFPFPFRLVDGTPKPPPGQVVRVSARQVTVREPELKGDRTEALKVRIELSRTTVPVTAPAKAIADQLEPDPIDLATILKPGRLSIAAPAQVTLTFERWRRGHDLADLPFLERTRLLRRRADVVLPEVTATLRFEVAASANLANAVDVWLKRGYEVREIAAAANASGFTGTLATGLTFSGKVMATPEILKDLGDRTDGWRWILNVPESDLPQDSDEPKEVTARLFLAPAERFKDLEAQGYIRFEPLNVAVQVIRVR